jgi:hypothetical protein
MSKELQHKELFQQVVDLLQDARQQVLRTVNSTMVYSYFEIGRMIVEEEQNGKERAEYGKQILKGLSKQLTSEFGKGFSVENFDRMRKFYRIYSNSSSVMRIFEILNSSSVMTKSDLEKFPTTTKEFENIKSQSLISFFKLTWTHYIFLMRIDDEKERNFYEKESSSNQLLKKTTLYAFRYA